MANVRGPSHRGASRTESQIELSNRSSIASYLVTRVSSPAIGTYLDDRRTVELRKSGPDVICGASVGKGS